MADKFLSVLIFIAFASLELAVIFAMADKSSGLFRKLFKKSKPASNADRTSLPFPMKMLIAIGIGLLIVGVMRWMRF